MGEVEERWCQRARGGTRGDDSPEDMSTMIYPKPDNAKKKIRNRVARSNGQTSPDNQTVQTELDTKYNSMNLAPHLHE